MLERKKLWRLAPTVLIGVLLAAGCTTGAGSLEAQPNSNGTEPTGSELTDPPAETAGLSVELVQWLLPVDANDYESGAEVYEEPFLRSSDLRLAGCLEAKGYRDLASAIQQDPALNVAGPGLFLFPEPPEWDVDDIASARDMPAVALTAHIVIGPDEDGSQKQQGVELLANDLQANPRFGVDSTRASALYDALRECLTDVPATSPTALEQADLFRSNWEQIISDIEARQEVSDATEEATECLQEIAPEFVDEPDPIQWLWMWDSLASSTSPEETSQWEQLHGWLNGYYDCMVPVIEIRRPLRLEARDRFVDENLPQLLELQSSLENPLQDLND